MTCQLHGRSNRMSVGTILIVEDDNDIAELVSLYLTRNDYKTIVRDGWDALTVLHRQEVDLVLLDVMLANANGFEICKEIRTMSDLPIMFMSAKADGSDKIVGLGLGADDYIAKPFNPSEVVARVGAHLRRYRGLKSTPTQNRVLRIAGLEIDEEGFAVRSDYDTVYLSAKEFQILKVMAENPGRMYRPEELYELVWRSDAAGDVRTVMVHISNLRKKIERDPAHPKYIITIRGGGYQFLTSPTSSSGVI